MRKCRYGILLLLSAVMVQGCKDAGRENDNKDKGAKAGSTDIYSEHVRTTEFQTPEEERKSFILPPGFEVTLFAAEPDITKPINMAFDAQGRLWVTQSSEYPVAAGQGEGSDRITILEDTDGDGRADKINDFANNLNIPIGIMPVKGGAIGYSIPNIYRFYDTDNDGKSDKREVMLGAFGHKDTHGMINNLIRGFDGWMHACHGYSNTSIVAGADGDSVKMVSGNTFRFTLDGRRVEKVTDGRINPFGFAYDEMGYLYSADCHTLPIYQLIWGGNYSQWGKKEPNMGFAPAMMDYPLNSTALAGLAYYTDNQFPEEYRNSFYSGDVVTCRISRNTIEFNGSTPEATRQEDFLVSRDPWFRPVDIKIGPDGAMYVADFYNRIIGHYEVPLDHPGRDRVSGRIWKITYKGNERAVTDWTKASLQELIKGLGHKVLAIRMTATDELVDRFGKKAIPSLKKVVQDNSTGSGQLIQGIWALYRLHALSDATLADAIHHKDIRVKVHAFKVMANYPRLNEELSALALQGLTHPNPHVQRSAAIVLSRHPGSKSYRKLITLAGEVPERDTHLHYAVLLGIKSHLEDESIMEHVAREQWDKEDAAVIALVASDITSEKAGDFLFAYLQKYDPPEDLALAYVESIARSIPEKKIKRVIDFAKDKAGSNPEKQYLMARALNQGLVQRGGDYNALLAEWNVALAANILAGIPADTAAWTPDLNARQQWAAEIAGNFKVTSLSPALKKLLATRAAGEETRAAAASALMHLAPEKNAALIYQTLMDGEEPLSVRRRFAAALGQAEPEHARSLLEQGLKVAPYDLQVTIAAIMASDTQGISRLMQLIRSGHAPARLLKARPVEEPLTANLEPGQRPEYERLTANVQPVSEARKKLIEKRMADFNPDGKTVTTGRAVFEKHCIMCHQIDSKGGLIGPQLDGIGNWGRKALTTKILDPNRNISEDFRTYNITLKNGEKVSGLYRREEGRLLVLANPSGEEFSVNRQDIKEMAASRYTLMPDNFHQVIPNEKFDALMVYLLSVQ